MDWVAAEVVWRVLDGFGCGDMKMAGMATKEMAQPRAWEWLSSIVEWVM